MLGCSWFEHRYRVAVTCDISIFKRIQDGPFQGYSQMLGGGGEKVPLPKTCHTYPTMMKLGSYTLPKEDLKKILIT